jgi:hypothetical protein
VFVAIMPASDNRRIMHNNEPQIPQRSGAKSTKDNSLNERNQINSTDWRI